MTTITIQLPDDKWERIRAAAIRCGLQLEEFVEKTLDTAVSREETVQTAFDFVLKKNEELYHRLAK